MARFIVVMYSASYPAIRQETRSEFDDMERAIAFAQESLSRHRKRLRVTGLACNRWLVFHVKHTTAAIEWQAGRDDSQASTKDRTSSTKEARKRRIGLGGSVTGERTRAIRVGAPKTPRKLTKLQQVVAEAKQRRAENESIRPMGGNPYGQI